MEKAPETINYFAQTDFRGQRTTFGIKSEDRSRHVYVIGKTGMGKSTLLENMAVQDLKNGEGMAFIDPHGKSADFLLDFVPAERIKDVVYFAPFDLNNPISFNIMEDVGKDQRHLVANGLMSTFKKIWPDVWSARMEYILGNVLLALLEYPDSTLLGVNRLLSDKNFRKKVIDNVSDPSVKSFWVDEFAKYNERYMQEAGDAIKNKIGQFTANPLIRNIIGQPKSSFDLREMMDNKKILIVNLSKGLLGEQNADLLGGMLVTKIYLAAMSRSNASAGELAKLPYFYLFVDEFQSFVNESFADILSEARKYKLSLTIAHQYVEQMPEEVKNAVFGNVGTTIVFRVGPFDALLLEAIFLPSFTKEDLVNLGFAQIYLTLMINGVGSPPFSATTLPPIVSLEESHRDEIVNNSKLIYSRPRERVEREIAVWYENGNGENVLAERKDTKEKKDDNRDQKNNRESLPKQKEKDNLETKTPNSNSNSNLKIEKEKDQGDDKFKIQNKQTPKKFSLGVLKDKTKNSGRGKDELRAVLSEILKDKNENKKIVAEDSLPKTSEDKNEKVDNGEQRKREDGKLDDKEIPKEVLEKMLKIDLDK